MPNSFIYLHLRVIDNLEIDYICHNYGQKCTCKHSKLVHGNGDEEHCFVCDCYHFNEVVNANP